MVSADAVYKLVDNFSMTLVWIGTQKSGTDIVRLYRIFYC